MSFYALFKKQKFVVHFCRFQEMKSFIFFNHNTTEIWNEKDLILSFTHIWSFSLFM